MNIATGNGKGRDGLQSTNPARDLRAVADLIELCFGQQLDRNDLAAVREMKAVASMGPLLWLLGDAAGLGLGYVWREEGRVVGNVSTYRIGNGLHGLGAGWMVANVAVHPDWRRRGIARALVDAALDLVVQRGGRWVVLQLDHDNQGARALYQGLGFEEIGRLTQWVHAGAFQTDRLAVGDIGVRRRRADEWQAELALAARDRVSELSWARALGTAQFRAGWLRQVWNALDGRYRARWVYEDSGRLLGSVWVDSVALGNPRLTLLLDPIADQVKVGLGLLTRGLRGLDGRRHVRLETPDRDPALAEAVQVMGFRVRRTLAQMRWLPPGDPASRQ